MSAGWSVAILFLLGSSVLLLDSSTKFLYFQF
jgi:hypothetical protein